MPAPIDVNRLRAMQQQQGPMNPAAMGGRGQGNGAPVRNPMMGAAAAFGGYHPAQQQSPQGYGYGPQQGYGQMQQGYAQQYAGQQQQSQGWGQQQQGYGQQMSQMQRPQQGGAAQQYGSGGGYGAGYAQQQNQMGQPHCPMCGK